MQPANQEFQLVVVGVVVGSRQPWVEDGTLLPSAMRNSYLITALPSSTAGSHSTVTSTKATLVGKSLTEAYRV